MSGRGRPRKAGAQYCTLSLRVSDAVYDALIREAHAAGVTISDILRQRLFVNKNIEFVKSPAQ